MLALRDAIVPIVRECQADFADSIRQGAKLEPRLEVKVRAGVLTITSLEVESRNLADRRLADCVQGKAASIELAVPDHADVDSHKLTYSLKLPVP
jgi:hypothetical protein